MAQLAYIMEDRLRSAAEEANKEKALKEVAKAIVKEKSTTIETIKERAREVERVHILAERRVTDLEKKT